MPVKKLKSNNGATILIALVFFLLCAAAGSVLLASGTASSGRMAGLVYQEQAYYSVSSAARMFRDVIENETFGYYVLEGDYLTGEDKEASFNSPTGELKELLSEGGKYIFNLSLLKRANEPSETTAKDYEKELSIDAGEGLDPVTCRFKMEKDTYNIVADFMCSHDGKALYKIRLTIPAALSNNLNEEYFTYDTIQGEGDDAITITHQYCKVTTTLSWGKGKITKLGKEES